MDERTFQQIAEDILARVVAALDEVDPDVVEAVPSEGVVRLEFGSARRPWIVNSQRGAHQIWLAAEQHAWHFAPTGDDPPRWVCDKTGDELFSTLTRLLREHEAVSVEL